VRAHGGAIRALASAALFGASTPIAKLLLRDIDPVMLAGLLYLGSGLGLLAVSGARRSSRGAESPLRGAQWLWLGLAILSGGIAAPVLLFYGLARASAAAAALLLNLEPIFTVLLAWLAFGEALSGRIGLGMAAIAVGAVVLTGSGGALTGGAIAIAAIAMACLGWAIDNNLTRKISLADPVRIAALKGCVAGAVNTGIALSLGAQPPSAGAAAAAGLLGLVGYGASLVLFVRALREIGAARTGAYFSLAPFFGAALSVLMLGEELSRELVLAGVLMGLGVWLHLTERHVHEHGHVETEHEHAHVHDAHHQHAHGDGESAGEPHSHRHRHGHLRHHHPHFPDAHHGHPH
jgi:drug/metabolite transporter (DMT)-like permease